MELHILFAAEPGREAEVQHRIEAALRRGRLTGPDGTTTTWGVERCGPGAVHADEARHAERLMQN